MVSASRRPDTLPENRLRRRAAARAAQEFSAGGEWGGSAVFIVEQAPEDLRGSYTAWRAATVRLGAAAGSLPTLAITQVLSESTLINWGWRLPFLIALPPRFIGLYLWLRLSGHGRR